MLEITEMSWSRRLLQREFTIRVKLDDREETLVLPLGEPTKGAVANLLIRLRYPQDEMEAIINNYLLDPSGEEAKAEFAAMQAYRTECKRCAEEVVKRSL